MAECVRMCRMKNFPAMAYAWTSAGPAGRPGARKFLIRYKKLFLAVYLSKFDHWSNLLR